MAATTAPPPLTEHGRRERIVREARALFTSHGYAAVSMQQIATAAEINKATLYHHFRDKEDLFVSVMKVEFAQLAAGLSEETRRGASARECLQRAASYFFRSSRSDFGRLMADLRQNVSVPKRDELMSGSAPPWEAIRDALAGAARRGEIEPVDPDLVARVFFAAVMSQMWLPGFGWERPQLDDRFAATLADLFIDGIGREGWGQAPSDTPER